MQKCNFWQGQGSSESGGDSFLPLKCRPTNSATHQQAPNTPKVPQPGLSRAKGGHPQRQVQIWVRVFPHRLSLPWCEGTNLGVFDLRQFDVLKFGNTMGNYIERIIRISLSLHAMFICLLSRQISAFGVRD